MTTSRLTPNIILVTLALLVSGCASPVAQEQSVDTRSYESLGDFQKVILVRCEIDEPYARQSTNRQAALQVDEILAREVPQALQNVEVRSVKSMANYQPGSERTLIIRPVIKQMEFINGGTRLSTGSLAGSSIVAMDMSFEDANSGTLISKPDFYQESDTQLDLGAESNNILHDVSLDAISYIETNR